MLSAGTTIGAIGLALAGSVIIIIALFADAFRNIQHRMRGTFRLRCPKCWYNLGGSPALKQGDSTITCSECGYVSCRTRHLRKSRRHWLLASCGAGLLLCAYGVHIAPDVNDRGWPAAVPTTALILAMPWLGPTDDGFTYRTEEEYEAARRAARIRLGLELVEHRIDKGALWRWQQHLLAERCLRGDRERQPVSWNWQKYYGRALHTLRGVVDGPPPWLDRAERLVDVEIETRPHWPLGVPIHGYVEVRRWHVDVAHSAEILSRTSGFVNLRAYELAADEFYRKSDYWQDYVDYLGESDSERDMLVYDVTINQVGPHSQSEGRAGNTKVERRYVLELPIRVAGSIDDVLTPVRSDEIDQVLRKILSVTLIVERSSSMKPAPWMDPEIWTFLGIDADDAPDTYIAGLMQDVTLGMTVDVLRDSTVVGSAEMWMCSEGICDLYGEGEVLHWFPYVNQTNVELSKFPVEDDSAQWSVRIRRNAEWALYNFQSNRYWDGEIELPLTIKFK